MEFVQCTLKKYTHSSSVLLRWVFNRLIIILLLFSNFRDWAFMAFGLKVDWMDLGYFEGLFLVQMGYLWGVTNC